MLYNYKNELKVTEKAHNVFEEGAVSEVVTRHCLSWLRSGNENIEDEQRQRPETCFNEEINQFS